MEQHSLYRLFTLGENLHRLQSSPPGARVTLDPPVKGKLGVLGAIQRMLGALEGFGFFITLGTSSGLSDFAEELKLKKKGARLSEDEAFRLTSIMKDVSTVLDAEAKQKYVYFVTPKVIPVDRLLGPAQALLPTNVYGELPEIAAYDVSEAAKCIAFSCATACAFHILRATEVVLREYYCRVVRYKRLQRKDQTWGKMLRDFEGRRRQPERRILDSVDHIGKNHRNPTAHPEARYDIEEAQQVFNLCTDAISLMVKDRLWSSK